MCVCIYYNIYYKYSTTHIHGLNTKYTHILSTISHIHLRASQHEKKYFIWKCRPFNEEKRSVKTYRGSIERKSMCHNEIHCSTISKKSIAFKCNTFIRSDRLLNEFVRSALYDGYDILPFFRLLIAKQKHISSAWLHRIPY